jgi:FixJ family two-component response regulator
VREAYATPSQRECGVMNLVVAVRRDRQAARVFDIAEIAAMKHCKLIKARLQP